MDPDACDRRLQGIEDLIDSGAPCYLCGKAISPDSFWHTCGRLFCSKACSDAGHQDAIDNDPMRKTMSKDDGKQEDVAEAVSLAAAVKKAEVGDRLGRAVHEATSKIPWEEMPHAVQAECRRIGLAVIAAMSDKTEVAVCGTCPHWHEQKKVKVGVVELGGPRVGVCLGGPIQLLWTGQGPAVMYPPTEDHTPACAKHPNYVPGARG